MTNINCSKPCKYQTDGKCCCDSVILPRRITGQDPACPYQTAPDSEGVAGEARTEGLIYDSSHEH